MGALERLADRLNQLEATVSALSGTPQLAASSIVQGAISQTELVDSGEVDDLGVTVYTEREVSRYGLQPDGSNTLVVLDGPRPPRPTMPHVTGGPGFLSVEWTGEFEDRTEAYADHDYVAVHVGDTAGFTPNAGTLAASIRSLSGESVVVHVDPGTWFVSLVAVSQAGIWSEPAPFTTGEPGTASGVDVTAREMAQAAQDAADAAATQAVDAKARAAESRALAAAVSAAANLADGRAIEAAMRADVVLVSADGKTRITYSRNPPGNAGGRSGDTWFQVDAAGGVIGFWECTTGDPASDPPEPVSAYPAAPTFEPTQGLVTIPASPGVTYLLDGRAATPGTYSDQAGPVAVIATAQSGYRIPQDATTAWVDTLGGDATPPALIETTPLAPTASDQPGEQADRLIVPAVDGVTYWAGGTELSPGSWPWSGTVRVTATPMPGYTFTAGADTSWTFTFSTARTAVTPEAPEFIDPNGTDNDYVSIPWLEGVSYSINGAPPGLPGHHPASGLVEVTASLAGDEYAFTPGAVTSWTHTFDTASYAAPAAPTFTATTYTIPTTEGVVYRIGGVPVTAGTYTAGAALVSTDFTGTNGAAWPSPWVRGWGRTELCQATIQANRGQMRVAGTGSWSDKLWMRAGGQRANLDITYDVTVDGTSESWHHLMLRVQQAGEEPRDCYDFLFDRTNVRLARVVNWSATTIGQYTAAGMALGTAYKVRAQAVDTALRVKMWPAGQAEPSSWHIDVTDSQWPTGYYGFLAVGGSQASPGYTHQIDNVVVTNPGGTGGTTVTVEAVPAPGWTLTGQTTWTHTFGG